MTCVYYIEVEKLSKCISGVYVLKNVSFNAFKGEVVGILGPNGSGKTTLLKVLAGFLRPDSGTIKVAGVDVTGDLEKLAELTALYIGGGYAGYVDFVSVRDNLYMYSRLTGTPVEEVKRLAQELGIKEELMSKLAYELSSGYRARLLLVGLLAKKPKILLLDEPTRFSDLETAYTVWSLIESMVEQGIVENVIFTTQDLDIACLYADRIVVLSRGTVRKVLSKEEVLGGEGVIEVRTCSGDILRVERVEELVGLLSKGVEFEDIIFPEVRLCEVYREVLQGV